MTLRSFSKRKSDDASFPQDIRGLTKHMPKMGSYAVLTVKGLKERDSIPAMVEEFSACVKRWLPNGEVELVTNMQEEGTHKRQTISLFALSLYIHFHHPEAQMHLSNPRFLEDEATEAQYAGTLHMTPEVLHTMHQSGLILNKQSLTSKDLQKLADGHTSLEEQATSKSENRKARTA